MDGSAAVLLPMTPWHRPGATDPPGVPKIYEHLLRVWKLKKDLGALDPLRRARCILVDPVAWRWVSPAVAFFHTVGRLENAVEQIPTDLMPGRPCP